MKTQPPLTLDAIRAMTPRERDKALCRAFFPFIDPAPDFSTDPAASAELKAALWRNGKYSTIETTWRLRSHEPGDQQSLVIVTIMSKNVQWKPWRFYLGLSDDPARDECDCLATVALLAVSATEGT